MTGPYNKIIYFCYQPSVGENYKKKINAVNHRAIELKNNLIVWPDNISALTCSPENLHKFKDSLNTKNITVVDQIKNKRKPKQTATTQQTVSRVIYGNEWRL